MFSEVGSVNGFFAMLINTFGTLGGFWGKHCILLALPKNRALDIRYLLF